MKKYRLKNANKVILATLNINTIANKFTALKEIVSNHIDILIIEETKLDETFPKGSFEIPGFKEPFRKDRNKHGGGIMVFVREDIPSRELTTVKFRENIEGLFIEINLRKSKWLLFATYKPPSFSKEKFFDITCNALDAYGKTYDNVTLTLDQEEVLLEFLRIMNYQI